MKRIAIAASLLFVAASTWAALAVSGGDGASHAPVTQPSATEPAQVLDVAPGLISLSLTGGEVQIGYPPDFALAVTPDQLLVKSVIPACPEPFDYCLYVSGEEFGNTNLRSAGLRISVRSELTAEMSCLLAQPTGWSDLQPGVIRTGTTSTSRFGDLGEGAAGSYSQGEVYRLWTGQGCYEFETRQVLTRFENYEPGAVTEFTAADQALLGQRFLAVIGSAALTSGEAIDWPVARSSDLRAFIQVQAPLRGEAVSSPLVVNGQAVGPWFFEASFPLELVTADGEIIATSYVTADGDWMTTDFVSFEGSIEFEVAQPTEAYLILRRDNPSDLREHDAATRVVLMLMPD